MEVGEGKSSRKSSLVLRNKKGFLTSGSRVFGQSYLSWRLWAVGSWGIGAGDIRILPFWRRRGPRSNLTSISSVPAVC